jgi:hypothetical protein
VTVRRERDWEGGACVCRTTRATETKPASVCLSYMLVVKCHSRALQIKDAQAAVLVAAHDPKWCGEKSVVRPRRGTQCGFDANKQTINNGQPKRSTKRAERTEGAWDGRQGRCRGRLGCGTQKARSCSAAVSQANALTRDTDHFIRKNERERVCVCE